MKVDDYEQEPDFSAGVDETFERFRQGAVATRRFEFPEHPEMNHVEAQILELVARLHPETFLRARALLRASLSVRRRHDCAV